MPLPGLWKKPRPSSEELSLSLSGWIECLNITFKTTLALQLATLSFEHSPTGIQAPCWRVHDPTVVEQTSYTSGQRW